MPISANFSVEGSSAVQAHVVAYGATVDFEILSLTGVETIEWSIIGTSKASQSAPTITPAGSPSGASATVAMPSDPGDGLGRGFIMKALVRAPGGAETAVAFRVFGAANAGGVIPVVANEENYRSLTHGWIDEFNQAMAQAGIQFGTGTDLGDAPQWNGSVWVKRRGWITPDADLTGAVDAYAAIQAALNSRAGACVKLPEGSIKVSTALTSNLNGVTLVGEDEGGTELYFDQNVSSLNALTFTGSQYNGVVGVKFRGGRVYTGGAAVQFSGTFMGFCERVRVDHHWGGIDVVNSTETRINHFTTRALYGEYSLWFRGTAGLGSYRCVLDTGLLDIPYPAAYPTNAVGIGAMARSTAYILNDIRTHGGHVWQCTTAGTTAGSGGPSIPSVSDPSALFSTAVTDGSAAWKWVCRTSHAHLLHDSFGYTLVATKVATLNGYNPLVMRDALNTGSSEPHFLFVSDLETDHNFGALVINKGAEIRIASSSLGATLGDHVVRIDAGVTLDCSLYACKMFGGQKNGIDIGADNIVLNACAIGNNGQGANNTYDGINVGSDVNGLQVTNCKSLNSGSGQRRGCTINDGTSDDYIVVNNDFTGNVTEGFYDGGSGSNKIVTPNID
jgi:hypothetical protein